MASRTGSTDLSIRYGRRPTPRRRLAGALALAALAGAFLAWTLWAGLSRARTDVRWQLLGFDASSASAVTVRLLVLTDAEASVECDVAAQNRAHETVGLRTVAAPPGSDERSVTVTVPVRERAVAAVVEGCRVVTP